MSEAVYAIKSQLEQETCGHIPSATIRSSVVKGLVQGGYLISFLSTWVDFVCNVFPAVFRSEMSFLPIL